MKNKKISKTSKKKKVEIEQNTKINISANTITNTIANISTNKSNLKDAVESSSSNLSQSFTSTDLNNIAIIPNQNMQHTENYQEAKFSKGI